MAGVGEAIRAAGAETLYLPPYRPDRNRIGQVLSKAKGEIRKRKPRMVAATKQLCGMPDALDWFTPDQCRNDLRHAGCRSQGCWLKML